MFSKAIFTAIFLYVSLLVPKKISAQVVINEYLPHPSSGSDWVEIYSPTDIDISGYILRDSTSDMKQLPAGLIVGPTTSTSCYVEVSNRLNNGGDIILLLRADGLLPAVDESSYTTDPGIDVSWCRIPAGGPWTTCSPPTKALTECASLVPTPAPTSSPTPTPTPTPSPTPTPTKTPTPTPTKSATPRPTSSPDSVLSDQDSESEELVLGLREQINNSEEVDIASNGSEKKKFPYVAILFIVLGLALMGGAGFKLWRNLKYNSGSETDI